MKTTKGPWTLRERADGGLSIKAGDLCLIAKVGTHAADYKNNAKLMTKAPELLAALVNLEENARNATVFLPHILLIAAVEQAQEVINSLINGDL
jgi:hypothetical protein